MAARPQSELRISWRVGVPHYQSDEAFADLLALVRANLDWLDEIALFETVTHHLYIPLEEFAARSALLARRIEATRAAGVPSVGVNVLTTIGHINEAWETMPPLPFQPMVGHDGAVSRGCACPQTPELRAYLRAKYSFVVDAHPDFIWIDDDLRMHNHGVAWACFCPTCLALFSDRTGMAWERQSLVDALDAPEGGDLRAAWVQHNADAVSALLSEVSAYIRALAPTTRVGLMTCGAGDLYAGAQTSRWMRDLGATKLRPGGGFYTDATPGGMVGKALDCGRGARAVHSLRAVGDIQYELENFPYQKLRKSATALLAECTAALATGCNGVALNMLPMWGGPYDDCAAFLPRLRRIRPTWEALVAETRGLPTAGLWAAWHPGRLARRSAPPGEGWFAHLHDHGMDVPFALAAIGLPFCLEPWEGARPPGCATVLSGSVAEAFTEQELRVILAGGVLLDSAALELLTARGLGELAGVRVARRIDNGAMEQFTDDPLNGLHAGGIRDARIEFWGDARGQADVLEPVADGVRVVAELRDYFRRPLGPCLTAYENPLGGRVAVLGYAPWRFLESVAKRAQILEIADWLAGGALPARIDSAVPLVPFVRMAEDRSRAVAVLLNAGLDPVERATVRLRLADGEKVETVPGLVAWETCVVRG